MSTLFWIVVGIVAVFVIWKLVNSKSLRNFFVAGNAQLSKLGEAAKGLDPMAVLKLRRDEQSEKLKDNLRILKELSGGLESLIRQVAQNEQQMNQYKAQAKKYHSLGQTDRAEQYAMDFAREEENFKTNKTQRDDMQKAFDQHNEEFQLAQRAIEDLNREISSLASQVKSSELSRKTKDMFSDINVGIDMDSVNEAKEAVRVLIDKNRGAGKVTDTLNSSALRDLRDQEDMRRQKARDVLAQFDVDSAKSPITNS